MNLVAFAKLLRRKINSAHKKAVNPFYDSKVINPFSRPVYMTYVWVESDDKDPNDI